MFAFEGGVDLSEIVTAVNRVGAAHLAIWWQFLKPFKKLARLALS
jgi:hypothetical protein